MKPTNAILVAVLAIGTALPALADTLPARKPGLWESKTDAGGTAVTMRQCIDAQTDQLAQGAIAGPPGSPNPCSKQIVRKTSAGYETETSCKIGTMTSEGKGLITGDFNAAIRMEITSVVGGVPGQAQPMTTKSVIENKYVGPCEASQKPGDIIMPGGQVIKTPGVPR